MQTEKTVAVDEYALEIKRLKAFSEKWTDYFNKITEKYPVDEELEKTYALVNAMNDIINGKDVDYTLTDKQKIEKIEGLFGRSHHGGLKEYPVSESGLDMNEVLFPSEELNLMDLCKELGLK